MIENLIYMAALNAPEIGDALVKHLARAFADAIAEEAKNRLSGGLAGFGSTLASLGADAFSGTAGKVADLSPELQAKASAILEDALKKFDLVLVKADVLAELQRAASANKTGS